MNVPVRECMSAPVASVAPDSSIRDAHYMMDARKIRRLPVVKDGALVGIITLHDIYQAEASEAVPLKVWELPHILAQVKVQSFMAVNPIVVGPDTPVKEAAGLMLKHKIGGLPVVDGGHVVGIVTESDLFRFLVERWPDG